MRPLAEIYRQPGGASPLAELVERLATAEPRDRARVDLSTYRGLAAPWNDWGHVVAKGRGLSARLARVAVEDAP
jgi:hypothetical protein